MEILSKQICSCRKIHDAGRLKIEAIPAAHLSAFHADKDEARRQVSGYILVDNHSARLHHDNSGLKPEESDSRYPFYCKIVANMAYQVKKGFCCFSRILWKSHRATLAFVQPALSFQAKEARFFLRHPRLPFPGGVGIPHRQIALIPQRVILQAVLLQILIDLSLIHI